MEIRSLSDLRSILIEVFKELDNDKIDILEANTKAKIASNIIASIKAEMQYALLTNQMPAIEFCESAKYIKRLK